MKKENRKAAQELRAKQRAKEMKKNKIICALKWGIPTVIAVVLIIGIVATSGVFDKEEASDTTSESTAAETTLNTTEGLEVEDGDVVNIDYTGYLDGEAFDGGSTNGAGADLEIGSDTYIDGFEEGIIGHTVGETFDLNLTFPENYGNEDLAGKDVVFETTINGIYE